MLANMSTAQQSTADLHPSRSVPKQPKNVIMQNIKRLLARCSLQERNELLAYLEAASKRDLIDLLPIHLARQVLSFLTLRELCECQLVSKKWNARVKDNTLWCQLCIEYSILPRDHILRLNTPISGDHAQPIYHDIFRRAMTMTRNWETFNCFRQVVRYHTGPVLSMTVLDSRRIVSGDIDGTIHEWNARTNQHTLRLKSHSAHVACLTHDSETVISGSTDKSIVIHCSRTFNILHRLLGHEGPVTSLALGARHLPYQHVLFSGSVDRSIRMWCTKTGACLRILYGQENTIQRLAYVSPLPPLPSQSVREQKITAHNKAGWIVSCSDDQSIYLWDLKTSRHNVPQVTDTIMGVHGAVTAMSVFAEEQDCSQSGPDNPYVAARKPLNVPPFVVCAGQYDSTVTLWSLPTLSPTYVDAPIQHCGTIWDMACAPIHSKILTVSGDLTAQIWDLKMPYKAKVLGGFDSALMTCAISPQEDFFCIGTESGAIFIFHMHEFRSDH